MASEAWNDGQMCEDYVDVRTDRDSNPMAIVVMLQYQRPWHSKIRLPTRADDEDEDPDLCHLESHDLDCLIVALRMLMSLGFKAEAHYRRSALMMCALHDFGRLRQSDYRVKGMLVQKLFPDDLNDLDVLRSKLTFENLLKHPGVDKVIFGCRLFGLQDHQLCISDTAPNLRNKAQEIRRSSYEDMTDLNEVKWDGIKPLGESVRDQSYTLDLRADGGTRVHRRFCTVPMFVRVMYTPDEDHPRSFDHVQRFKLIAPRTEPDEGLGFVCVPSNSTYILRAIVKMDPRDPIGNPAEVRLYDFNANMMLPERMSRNSERDSVEHKIRPDTKWKMGDPKFKFLLFYSRWDPPTGISRSTPPPARKASAQYRSPSPVHHFYRARTPPSPSLIDSRISTSNDPPSSSIPSHRQGSRRHDHDRDRDPSRAYRPAQDHEQGQRGDRRLVNITTVDTEARPEVQTGADAEAEAVAKARDATSMATQARGMNAILVGQSPDMMQDGQKSDASASGEEELRKIAQQCMSSSEKYHFVVGPSRSGKSTRLPIMMALLNEKQVICVQPDDWSARYHAEWLEQSPAARTYNGRRAVVGYYPEDAEIPVHFVPGYAVTYVSYKWLYRLIVGVNTQTPGGPLDDEDQAGTRIARQEVDLRKKRKRYGECICAVVLDEFHAQLLTQELGYLAAYVATSGVVQAPVGFHKGTKVIITTAYPENNTFQDCFDLSREQIEQQTLTIHKGLAPAFIPGIEIEERYIGEGERNDSEYYHQNAIKIAKGILTANEDARILFLMDAKRSARNIARQSRVLENKATVLDLETKDGRDQVFHVRDKTGGIVILVTPNFASRIPVEGITDVICPSSMLQPILHKDIHREVLESVYLSRSELAWAKSHLDPAYKSPTVHYVFARTVGSELSNFVGAKWLVGDYVDFLMGLVRLCRENALGERTPVRFQMPMTSAERAFRQLTLFPTVYITKRPISATDPTPTSLGLSEESYVGQMLRLMDRCGLDRRQASFLARLEDRAVESGIGAHLQVVIKLAAVAMVVFDEEPILRRVPGRKIADTPTEVFGSLQCFFSFAANAECVSDAWINAVVWMDTKRRAKASNLDVAEFARQQYSSHSKSVAVDKVPLEAAEDKVTSLATMLDVHKDYVEMFCDGRFLDMLEDFNLNAQMPKNSEAALILWETYMETYLFNLVFIVHKEDSVTITDISSGRSLDLESRHLAIDLSEQAELAKKNKTEGFYATAVHLIQGRIRSLTVIPHEFVYRIMKDEPFIDGAWDLHTHLRLQ
ncbi:hypothetical protein HD806DRAFT_535918 [Xylariaceae sp. AK1471]|nr:hypothetical protein HD806DRAFT_535918 [Xylariaceae sp. AK1471]